MSESVKSEPKKKEKKSKAKKAKAENVQTKDADGDIDMTETKDESSPKSAEVPIEQELEMEPSAKGSKTKRKRDGTRDETANVEEPVAKRDKKEKKGKREKKEKGDKKDKKDKTKVKQEAEDVANDQVTASDEAEKWNVGELEGGSARQDKFMRLLGGKKSGVAAPGKSGHKPKEQSTSTKAEADIQRQFEAGMKMKAEGAAKRRGLGA